jgi:hypothetical protein
MLSAGGALFLEQREGAALGWVLIAVVLAATATLLVWQPPAAVRDRCRRALPLVMAAAVLLVAATALATFAPNGWDECAYLLSGLALRGEPVPYADHRAPLAGLLCAVFAGMPALMNPALLVLLFGTVAYWARRQWGMTVAAVIGLLLLSQDLLLLSAFDITSELPAAVMLTLGFLALSSRRPFTAGVFLGLTCLARWNMAALAIAVVAASWVVWGPRRTARLALGVAAPVLLWFVAATALDRHPLDAVVAQYVTARAATFPGRPPATLWSRAARYLPQFFFLTPLGFFGLLWSPMLRSEAEDDVTLRFVAPAGLMAVCVTMLLVGGRVPRFFAPLMPVALMIACRVFFVATETTKHGERARLGLLACASVIVWGLFPLNIVSILHTNVTFQPAFTPALTAAIAAQVPAREPLSLPPVEALALHRGLPLMYELRRVVDFPSATFDSTDTVVPDPDPRRAVQDLLGRVPAGRAVIVPGSAADPARLQIILSDGGWALARTRAREPGPAASRKTYPGQD